MIRVITSSGDQTNNERGTMGSCCGGGQSSHILQPEGDHAHVLNHDVAAAKIGERLNVVGSKEVRWSCFGSRRSTCPESPRHIVGRVDRSRRVLFFLREPSAGENMIRGAKMTPTKKTTKPPACSLKESNESPLLTRLAMRPATIAP